MKRTIMEKERIYLDYNATTPLDPEVIASMKPFLNDYFGNPSSAHWYGLQTKIAVEKARKQLAAFLHCDTDEVIFTSGGTESNNTAIRGIAFANQHKGNHIITSSIEHPAVLEVCRYLEKFGFETTYLPVDEYGRVDPEQFRRAIRPETILATIMHANNEVGTIQPIRELAIIAHDHGIFFHTDAAQSAGKIPVDVRELGVDLLSLAGHKLYAPKGIGALYIKRGTPLEKLMYGADHERNLRAGTENTLEITGLGTACEIAGRDLDINMKHYRKVRDKLYEGLTTRLPEIRRNGDPENGLPNTLSISFHHVEANTLVSELDMIAVSAGAACHSDNIDISHVLEAMKVPVDYAMGTIRFSVGRFTTEEQIDKALEEITAIVQRLRPDTETQEKIETIPENGEIRLTHFTSGMGCACKLRPQALERVLKQIPVMQNDHVLVGPETNDDAAVYLLDENTALVNTVDFFTPIVDDPYWFGAIAAANALSDIYAMGAEALFALNIVGFPSNRLSMDILKEILKGAHDKCEEAGIPILGGHTIDDVEPKFGMVVTGKVHPGHILTNDRARPGDILLLTKPIGTGIIATGVKQGLVSEKDEEQVTRLMATLNKKAAGIMRTYPVDSCTDVTGFGLSGHLGEMTRASGVTAEVTYDNVPVLPLATLLAEANIIPGGTKNNLEYTAPFMHYADSISYTKKIILNDAQTSGGLLIAIPEEDAEKLSNDLTQKGVENFLIGKISGKGNGDIYIR